MTIAGLTDKVDEFAYGMSFVAIALGTLFLKGTFYLRQIAVTIMTVAWGLRLGLFLMYRSYYMKDFRTESFKKNFVGISTLWLFQSLAIWTAILPVAILNSFSHNPTPGLRDMLGYVMFGIGFVMEIVADYQQFNFKQQHKDRFCNVGLFRYSRHPNYFGDLLLWWGIFTCVAPVLRGWTWISILGPLFHTFMILFVTGIPPLEKRCNEHFQNDPNYQRYKVNTPILIPAIPKTPIRGKMKRME